jgi:hypothetical protein
MFFQYIYESRRVRCGRGKPLLLSAVFYVLTILTLILICYDNDISDGNDPPVVALQSPIIIYHAGDEVKLIKSVSDSINLALADKIPPLNKAPPVQF